MLEFFLGMLQQIAGGEALGAGYSRYSCGMLLDAWIFSHLEMEPPGFISVKENWEFGWIIKKIIQWEWSGTDLEAGMGMRTLDKHGNAQG